jgi:flagellar protein FliO/FliZ
MSESVIYVVTITLLIALAGLGFWIARQSLGMGSMNLFQPRPKRIGLVEAAMIDGRRRLLLVRRDGVEHLILTGGPVDVVVETGINPPLIQQPAFEQGYGRTEPSLPDRDSAYTDMPLVMHSEQPN